MLTVAELELGLDGGDWVVFTPTGDLIDMEIPRDIGPATLLVSKATDALKRREGGRLVGALDRDRTWSVVAFALNRVVVEKLRGEMTPRGLYRAVRELGLAWQVSEL